MMKQETTFEVAIVGGGVAGAACALRAAQYHLPAVWILGDRATEKGSRGRWVQNIDNMIGVHADIVLDKLRHEWRARPELLAALDELPHLHVGTRAIIDNVGRRLEAYGEVMTRVAARSTGGRRLDDGRFEIETDDAEHGRVLARAVIAATGVMDRQPLIARRRKGRTLEGTHWIYPYANRETVFYCVRCEGHLSRDSHLAVIGGSETAAQIALMIAERYDSTCCLLTNGEQVAIAPRTRRLLDHHGIIIHTARLVDILGKEDAPPGSLHGFLLEDGTRVEVAFALVSLGLYRVYNDLARALGADLADAGRPDEVRHVRVDRRGESSVRGLFAIGDLATRDDEPIMKQIYTAQEYAVRAVDTIDRRWRSRRRKEILGET
jgi:thioredoxin reductase (NADPH)